VWFDVGREAQEAELRKAARCSDRCARVSRRRIGMRMRLAKPARDTPRAGGCSGCECCAADRADLDMRVSGIDEGLRRDPDEVEVEQGLQGTQNGQG